MTTAFVRTVQVNVIIRRRSALRCRLLTFYFNLKVVKQLSLNQENLSSNRVDLHINQKLSICSMSKLDCSCVMMRWHSFVVWSLVCMHHSFVKELLYLCYTLNIWYGTYILKPRLCGHFHMDFSHNINVHNLLSLQVNGIYIIQWGLVILTVTFSIGII